MKRCHDNFSNRKYLIEAGLQFQRFSPLWSWWLTQQIAGQAGMVLEKELRGLHFDPKAGSRRLCVMPDIARAQETSKPATQ